ncbi:hypothetical protein MJO29_016182 [Puccinia striiformis f. sp. tritici]|nr:hypothetical protein MJO29_016182 [Puccinia striiformis f. sp. tritici]
MSQQQQQQPSVEPTTAEQTLVESNQQQQQEPSRTDQANSESSTNKTTQQQQQQQQPVRAATGRQPTKSTTRKKLIHFLLPCFHPSLHDEHSTTITTTKPPPTTTTTATSNEEPTREMSETGNQGGASSLQSSGTTTRRSPIVIAKEHLRKNKLSSQAGGTGGGTASRRTGSNLPTPVSDTITPAGAAAATSAANAHGGAGVQVPISETEGVLSGAVVPPGKDTLGLRKSASALRLVNRNLTDDSSHPANKVEDHIHSVVPNGDEIEQDDEEVELDEDADDEEEDRIVAMGGMGIPTAADGTLMPLLPALDLKLVGRKCLVLDLDETLVHSSFKVIPSSDFVVPVEIENSIHNVHVIKRPGVDEFMRKMGEIYEVVVFTASLSKYADPVLDILDIHKVVRHRLFRESCYNHKGNYVKDLSQLGRPIQDTIIIDNSPASYVFHPNNAVPVSSWFNDPHDTELTDLANFLADIANVNDVRTILDPRL